jgi:hypothetical protein
MRQAQFSSLQRWFLSFGVIVVLGLTATAGASAREKVLYHFTGGADGAYPSSGLTMDAAGNFYGVTSQGGNLSDCTGDVPGCGVVFELTQSNGKWQESVLYAFQGGTDGWNPSGNLLLDSAGNLYGTTLYGGTGTTCGTSGCGTVFELSPNGDGSWTETVIHNFQYGSDGAFPAGLTADASGNLYGVTTSGNGTVYELSPLQGGTWKETLLCSTDGANPGLALAGKNNFYFTAVEDYDNGHVFEVKRIGKLWHETDIYDFQGGGNGGGPKAGVVVDKDGNLYGTASDGGNDFGIAFELKRSAGQWKESMLYNFCSRNNCADGANPQAPLVFDQAGNLYGTTTSGGTTGCYPELGCGVVFKLSHNKGGWSEAVLHKFRGGSDGSTPTAGLILDASGDLYGTTASDVYEGFGTVFEVTP